MNFKSHVTNKCQEVLLKKAIYVKDIMSLKDLRIDRANQYEEQRFTQMSEQMFQHLSQESDSCLENVFRLKKEVSIEGKADGQPRRPSNFEQPTLVQKKTPMGKNGYDLSLISKVGISGLKLSYYDYDNSLHNKPLDVEDGLPAHGDMNTLPIKSRPMRSLHEIQMSSGEYPQVGVFKIELPQQKTANQTKPNQKPQKTTFGSDGFR